MTQMDEPEIKVKVTADTSGFEGSLERMKETYNKWGEALSESFQKAADSLRGEEWMSREDFLAELDRLEAIPESDLTFEPEPDDEVRLEYIAEPLEKADMASKERTWDAGAARKAIKAKCTGADGKVDVNCYAQAFLYKGCKTSGKLGDCKFPIKTVIGGKLVTVPRAVAAAKARLNQGKGISKAKAGMKNKLNAASKQIGWKPNTLQKSEIEVEHLSPIFNVPDRKNTVTWVVYKPNTLDSKKQWASKEAIEEAAHWYMEHSQLHDVNHKELTKDAVPVESYIAKSDQMIAGRDVPEGSWVTTTLLSDELYGDFQEGALTGGSMFGRDLALYGSVPPGMEVQDEDERMSIAELARIRPQSLGLVGPSVGGPATKEPILIAKCDGSGCPLTEKEETMEIDDKGVAEVPKPEDMAKAEGLPELPEEIRPIVEEALKKSHDENVELKKQVEEAMAKAAELEDKQKTQEFMAKASEFDHMPTDGLGEMLKGISEKAPDEYAKLEELLRATNTGLAKSAAFEEIGSNKITPDSLEGKIESAAAEIMAKSDGKITKTQAELQAWAENPTLYAEYRNNMRRR
jgi:hypothetical protein